MLHGENVRRDEHALRRGGSNPPISTPVLPLHVTPLLQGRTTSVWGSKYGTLIMYLMYSDRIVDVWVDEASAVDLHCT
jgi:hypothetical protein